MEVFTSPSRRPSQLSDQLVYLYETAKIHPYYPAQISLVWFEEWMRETVWSPVPKLSQC